VGSESKPSIECDTYANAMEVANAILDVWSKE